MFGEHPYGKLPHGLVDTKTGELIAGFGTPAEIQRDGWIPKTHPHLLVGVQAPSEEVVRAFSDEVEQLLPSTYQHLRFYTSSCPKIWEALGSLVYPRTSLKFSPSAIHSFEEAVDNAFPGFVARETHKHLNHILGLDGPRLVFFALPSVSFCRTIMALEGKLVAASEESHKAEAAAFVEALALNTGWQTGDPPTHGDYEAQWESDATHEVLYLPPQGGASQGAWFLQDPHLPLLPPQRWRPLLKPTT